MQNMFLHAVQCICLPQLYIFMNHEMAATLCIVLYLVLCKLWGVLNTITMLTASICMCYFLFILFVELRDGCNISLDHLLGLFVRITPQFPDI